MVSDQSFAARRRNFVDDLKGLMDRHRVGLGLVATCYSEGIYGELSCFDPDDEGHWYWRDMAKEMERQIDGLSKAHCWEEGK